MNNTLFTVTSAILIAFLPFVAFSQDGTKQPIAIAKLSQAEESMNGSKGESVVQWFRLRGKIADAKKSVDDKADVLRQLSTTSKYLFHERWQSNEKEQQSQLVKVKADGSVSNYVENTKNQTGVYSSVWPSERQWFVINKNPMLDKIGCIYSGVEGANLQFFGNAGLSSLLKSATQIKEAVEKLDGEEVYVLEEQTKTDESTRKITVRIATKDGVELKKSTVTSLGNREGKNENFFVFYTPISFMEFKGRRVPKQYAKSQWWRMNGDIVLLELTVGDLLSIEESGFDYWRSPLGAIVESPDVPGPAFVGADVSSYVSTLAASEISPEVVEVVLQNFQEVKEAKPNEN